MKRKTVIGISIVILVCFLSVYIFSFVGTLVHAENLQDRLNSVESQKGDLQQKLNEVRENKAAKIEDAAAVEEKMSGLQDDIDVIQGEIDDCEVRIVEKTEELEEAQKKETGQYNAMKLRLRAMYEDNTASYLSLLLSGDSLTDILSYVEIIKQMVSYDSTMHENLETTRQTIADAKEELEAEKKISEEKKTQLDEKMNSYEAQKDELEQIIANLNAEEAQAMREYQEAEAAARSLKAQIAAASQPAPSQPSGGGQVSGGGSFIYPCAGYTSISSDYGYRMHPTLHVYKLHTGVDFPVPSGTPVRASSSGTVVTAGWNTAYGNVVVISHGNGLSTLYAHNSSLAVSAGQTVSQGTVIAYSGSTGYSTGPHCHFEVLKNGSAMDPKAYL